MSRVIAVAALLAALATTMTMTGAAKAAEKLVLQLHGPPQFEFAGYYAALWQGFYREAGLDVAIKPGAGIGEKPVDPAREVTDGRAQFGIGTAELVIRAAQGQPLLILMPIFQRSGAEVYYRASEDYASPGALAEATVGRLPASNILDIELATALKAEGVDPGKIASLPLRPGQTVAALAQHRAVAVPGSAWEFPWLAHQQGVAVKSFNPADYRVEFYGDSLFTLRRLAAAEPAVVRGFRAASLRGWDYALRHPDEIAARLLAQLPHPPGIADAAGFDHYQAALARALARFPAVPLGHSNPDRWRHIEQAMLGVGALLRTAETSDFVYDPDAAARARNDLRSFALLGAALLIGLAVIAWAWQRGRRPLAAVPPAGGEPDAAAAPQTPEAAAVVAPAAPAPREPMPADLNAVIARLDRAIRRRLPRLVAFRLSLLPELWRCRAEPRAVRTLVLDLVTAAARDLSPNGELVVGTRNFAFTEAALAAAPGARLGDYVRVTVRDNGPGLAEEALDRIFDPAATARPEAVAAAAAVGELGGFARVESAIGVGTAVHLYFPRAPVATAAGGGASDKPKDAAA